MCMHTHLVPTERKARARRVGEKKKPSKYRSGEVSHRVAEMCLGRVTSSRVIMGVFFYVRLF